MDDPAIGRFTSVNPIAEEFAFVSGFNYAENEPIANIDLHGLQKVDYRIRAELKLTQGVIGAEAKIVGAKLGESGKIDSRTLIGGEISVGTNGVIRDGVFNENSSTIGVSYGDAICLSGSVGKMFSGIERGIYLESVTENSGLTAESINESRSLIDNGVHVDNTSTILYIEKLATLPEQDQIKPRM